MDGSKSTMNGRLDEEVRDSHIFGHPFFLHLDAYTFMMHHL
jgi:hypothetical protein